MKVTVPALGVPVLGGTTSTVAVRVIAWPTVPDVAETLKAVEVGIPAITVTEQLASDAGVCGIGGGQSLAADRCKGRIESADAGGERGVGRQHGLGSVLVKCTVPA